MDKVAAIIGLLAVLFLVSRGLPGRQWPVIVAIMLAVVIVVVGVERSGYWPESWKVK